MPGVRLHDLRHNCASHMLAAGRPVRAVAAHLGHSTPAITLAVRARHPRTGGRRGHAGRIVTLALLLLRFAVRALSKRRTGNLLDLFNCELSGTKALACCVGYCLGCLLVSCHVKYSLRGCPPQNRTVSRWLHEDAACDARTCWQHASQFRCQFRCQTADWI